MNSSNGTSITPNASLELAKEPCYFISNSGSAAHTRLIPRPYFTMRKQHLKEVCRKGKHKKYWVLFSLFLAQGIWLKVHRITLNQELNVIIKNAADYDFVGLLGRVVAVPEHIVRHVTAHGGRLAVAQERHLYRSGATASLRRHLESYTHAGDGSPNSNPCAKLKNGSEWECKEGWVTVVAGSTNEIKQDVVYVDVDELCAVTEFSGEPSDLLFDLGVVELCGLVASLLALSQDPSANSSL